MNTIRAIRLVGGTILHVDGLVISGNVIKLVVEAEDQYANTMFVPIASFKDHVKSVFYGDKWASHEFEVVDAEANTELANTAALVLKPNASSEVATNSISLYRIIDNFQKFVEPNTQSLYQYPNLSKHF